MTTFIVTAGVIILFVLGIPVGYSLGVAGLLAYFNEMGSRVNIPMLAQRMQYGVNNFLLLAIPLFILAAYLMDKGDVSNRIIEFSKDLVGHLPGLGRCDLDQAVREGPQRQRRHIEIADVGPDRAVRDTAAEGPDDDLVHPVSSAHAGAFVRLQRAVGARVSLVAGARVEVMRQFACELEVRTSDRLDLVDTARLAFASRFEAPAQFLERALDECEMQIRLVVEVNVDQRATQPGPPGDLVHRDCVPADFGVEGLGRIDDLGTAAILFFLAAFGEVCHG